MVDKLLTKLSQNLLEILNEEEYYDITIEVGNDPYVKVFRAHMVILNYRSPYLRRILSTNKKNNDGTLSHTCNINVILFISFTICKYNKLTKKILFIGIFTEEESVWKSMMCRI